MDVSLERRLHTAEDDFLTAIANDDDSLKKFESRFSVLAADVNHAIQDNQIEPTVVELAFTTASRVERLAHCVLDLNVWYDKLTKELKDQFARVTISDSLPCAATTSGPTKRVAIPADGAEYVDPPISLTPPYIAPAYKWLLENIHNPYPTKKIKDSISDSTGTSLKLIDEWFMNVRRRMGWTALARKYFMKSRSDTIDAAYRALVKDDPLRPIPADIQGEFVAMEDRAKNLYSDKFRKSALAGKLSVAVRNMTAEDKKKREDEINRAEEEETRRWQNDKEVRRQKRAKEREAQKKAHRAQLSYPSPARLSDLLPLTDESDDDTTPPEPLAGRKRRMSSSDTASDNEPSSISQRKRVKTSGTSQVCPEIPDTGLPSPQASLENLNDSFDSATPSRSLTTTMLPSLPTSTVASAQRKRRRSDADAQPAYKHPRGYIGPRLHAVSDPLPMSASLDSEFDSWFQSSFDVPPAATIDELDRSRVEVELFKGWPTNFEEFVDSPLSSEATTPFSGQELELPESELRSVTPEAFGVHLLSRPSMDDQAKINSTDIPDIFEETTFDDWAYPQSDKPVEVVVVEHASAPVMPILPPDNVDLPHLDLDSLFSNINLPAQSYPEFDIDSFLSTTSVQSPVLDPNINWEDMVYPLPILNVSNEVAPPGGDLTHEYSSFDPLAFLFNTDVLPVLAPQNDEVSKAEKRRKLAELKEAQRRLEAELSE